MCLTISVCVCVCVCVCVRVRACVCVQELRQYLSSLADQCSGEPASERPLVVILDNLHHVSSLGEIFNGLFNSKHQYW